MNQFVGFLRKKGKKKVLPTRKRPPLSQKLNLVKTLKYEHYAMRVLIFELVFCSGHRRKTLMNEVQSTVLWHLRKCTFQTGCAIINYHK